MSPPVVILVVFALAIALVGVLSARRRIVAMLQAVFRRPPRPPRPPGPNHYYKPYWS